MSAAFTTASARFYVRFAHLDLLRYPDLQNAHRRAPRCARRRARRARSGADPDSLGVAHALPDTFIDAHAIPYALALADGYAHSFALAVTNTAGLPTGLLS